MNLVKNVDGDWSTAKGRVRQDLDSVQRAFNALQAQFDALFKQVNTPAAIPAATITAANKVTVPNGDFLSVVAVGAGLTGDGRVVNPLVATGTPLTVDVAGALVGDGTVASPLAVNVDGVTVTINGSNQLVASGGGGGTTILTKDITLDYSATSTWFGTPIGFGITGGFTVPLCCAVQAVWGAFPFNEVRSVAFAYDVNANNNVFGGASAQVTTNAAGGMNRFTTVAGPSLWSVGGGGSGDEIYAILSGSLSDGGGSHAGGITMRLYYISF